MGIDNLNKFLLENAPGAKTQITAESLRNTSVAIDAHNLMYRLMYSAQKKAYKKVNLRNDPNATQDVHERNKYWVREFLEFVIKFVNASITPIFVFDGKHMPEKAATQEERRKAKKVTVATAKELAVQLEQQDPFDRSQEDLTRLKKLKTSVTYLNTDQVDQVKSILRLIGVPVIEADGDGEWVCCMLCHEQIASAVYSSDTDCMVLGCPLMLSGFVQDSYSSGLVFNAWQFGPILGSLGLTYPEFVDLCIMGGCDYNVNMKNVRLKTAYKDYILPYRSIDKIPSHIDTSCLNHEFCREIFQIKPVVELIDEKYDRVLPSVSIDKTALQGEHVRSTLRNFGLERLVPRLLAGYQRVSRPIFRPSEEITQSGRVIPMKSSVTFEVLPSGPSENGPKFTIIENKITVIREDCVDPIRDLFLRLTQAESQQTTSPNANLELQRELLSNLHLTPSASKLEIPMIQRESF